MKYFVIFILIFSVLTVHVCAVDIDRDTIASYIEGADGNELAVMLAVGAVIRNRCLDDRFPDSVIENGNSLGIMPSPTPSDMAKYAADIVISGKDITGGAVFMFPKSDKKAYACHCDHITFSCSGLCFSLR